MVCPIPQGDHNNHLRIYAHQIEIQPSICPKSLYLATPLNSPAGGVDDLHKIFHGRQRMAKVPTQQQQQPFYGPLSGTTRVSLYQKKHSPTHHPDHHPICISFFHLPRSTAFSLFKLRAWQSFCTSLHVHFGLPLGLEPSTSYSKHFFTQSVSSFRSTCPYHRNLFCGSISIVSSLSTSYQIKWYRNTAEI